MNEIERICGDIADMPAPNGKISAYLCVASYQHEMPHHTGFAPTNPLGGVMHWSDDSHYRRANSEPKPPQQPDAETSRLDESDTAMWFRRGWEAGYKQGRSDEREAVTRFLTLDCQETT